jgi:Tfp pilus assembly pilus retraction ATPase PilT
MVMNTDVWKRTNIYISDEEKRLIDEYRGDTNVSKYIRDLIDKEITLQNDYNINSLKTYMNGFDTLQNERFIITGTTGTGKTTAMITMLGYIIDSYRDIKRVAIYDDELLARELSPYAILYSSRRSDVSFSYVFNDMISEEADIQVISELRKPHDFSNVLTSVSPVIATAHGMGAEFIGYRIKDMVNDINPVHAPDIHVITMNKAKNGKPQVMDISTLHYDESKRRYIPSIKE